MSDAPARGRYVMVGFDSDAAALAFLTHLHELEDPKELLVASRKSNKKVVLTKYKIRTAYLKGV
jgi:hypothetical protein